MFPHVGFFRFPWLSPVVSNREAMYPICKSKLEHLEEVQHFWAEQRNLCPEEQAESSWCICRCSSSSWERRRAVRPSSNAGSSVLATASECRVKLRCSSTAGSVVG